MHPTKGQPQGSAASVFRVRELLIRQRTQAINALRGHLGEYGHVVPQGVRNVGRLIALIESEASDLPATARASLDVLAGMLAELDRQIGVLDAEIDRRARESEVVRRLMTIPGIGPLDLPGKSGEHQLRNQEVFYGKREQADAGISA